MCVIIGKYCKLISAFESDIGQIDAVNSAICNSFPVFIHYCNMFMKYVSRAAYIPAHTSHEISNAMVERLRELGGDIWFNCRAEKFLFDGDKVCGVRTNN